LGAGASGANIDDAAWISNVNKSMAAPVVVDVVSK
jgi:hypothetical protein